MSGILSKQVHLIVPGIVADRQARTIMSDRSSIIIRLKELMKMETDRDLEEVDESTSIREGIGLDSVDLMSVVTRVEESYRVRFTHQDLESVTTVGSLIDLVVAKIPAA